MPFATSSFLLLLVVVMPLLLVSTDALVTVSASVDVLCSFLFGAKPRRHCSVVQGRRGCCMCILCVHMVCSYIINHNHNI